MSDEITEVPLPLNPLPAENRTEAREKRTARRVFQQVYGAFARTMMRAMDEFTKARQQGVDRDSAIKGIEAELRGAWGKPTTKFGPQCLVCDDIGYEEMVCRQWARCERPEPRDCNRKGPEFTHTYVVPCQCVKGDRFRKRAYVEAEAQATLGKVAKRKSGFTRMGS